MADHVVTLAVPAPLFQLLMRQLIEGGHAHKLSLSICHSTPPTIDLTGVAIVAAPVEPIEPSQLQYRYGTVGTGATYWSGWRNAADAPALERAERDHKLNGIPFESRELYDESPAHTYGLIQRQADLLSGVVNALRGPPAFGCLHSHHDAPELAEAAAGDTKRLDWLADTKNKIGNVQLPRAIVEANVHSLRAAIDDAMALPPEPDNSEGERP